MIVLYCHLPISLCGHDVFIIVAKYIFHVSNITINGELCGLSSVYDKRRSGDNLFLMSSFQHAFV